MPGCYLSQIARLPHCCSQPYTSPYARCRASLCTVVRLQLPRGARVPVQVCGPLPSCIARGLPLQEGSERPTRKAAHGGTHKQTATAAQHSQPVGQPRMLGHQPVTCRYPLPSVWDKSHTTQFEQSEKHPSKGAECLRNRPYSVRLSLPLPN